VVGDGAVGHRLGHMRRDLAELPPLVVASKPERNSSVRGADPVVIAPAPPAVRVVVGVVVVIVGHTRDKEVAMMAMMVMVLMREVLSVEGCPLGATARRGHARN